MTPVLARTSARMAAAALCLAQPASGAAEGVPTSGHDRGARIVEDTAASHILDADHRQVEQRVCRNIAELQARRFIEIVVSSVHNPARRRLVFEVGYRDRHRPEVRLGLFSLFPPDNPGTFLVPTGGRLRPGGTIVVRMLPLDSIAPDDSLRIELRRFRLRGE